MATGALRCRCSSRSAIRASRSRTTPPTASSTATPRPSTTCTRCCRTSRTSTSRTSAAARPCGTSRSRAPGTSTSPGILAVLRDGGYEGPASVEIEFDGTWPELAGIDAVMKAGATTSWPAATTAAEPPMIGIAILGAGFMGQTHAGAWTALGDRVRVEVVASRTADRAAAVAETAGSGDVVGRPRGGDRRPARRPGRHLPADAAAPPDGRGGVQGRQARAAREAAGADARGRRGDRRRRRERPTLLVGLVLRHWPEYQRLHALAAEGAIGAVRSASALRLSPPADWADWFIDPAQSGGVAVDLMVHDFDQLNALLGPATHGACAGVRGGPARRAAAHCRRHVAARAARAWPRAA